MDANKFWAIIDKSISRDDEDEQLSALRQQLSTLTEDELIAFESQYRAHLIKVYDWDLWGAAYLINDGCSDDGFDYFRDWLIAQGRKTYFAALENPDSLAKTATIFEAEFESFRYVMYDVFETRFSKQMPSSDTKSPKTPSGEPWEEGDLDAKFPALSAWAAKAMENDSGLLPLESRESFWRRILSKDE